MPDVSETAEENKDIQESQSEDAAPLSYSQQMMRGRRAMDESKYLAEVKGRLRREGFTVEMPEEAVVTVSIAGYPLCHINGSSGIRREKLEGGLEHTCDQAVSIARSTAEYRELMESAPLLKAEGLTGDYRLLAEFNNVVLAGHERDSAYGTQFVTWERTYDRAGLWQGHYYENNYDGARQDFAVRSGLLDQDRLFTNEQLAEVYRCIHETLDSSYPITDSRREILQTVCKQIENAVSNLDELVQQSNREELEFGESQPGQESFMSSY